jgi:hypothetical protein
VSQKHPCATVRKAVHLPEPAPCALQQYDRSNHRYDDPDGSSNQHLSPPGPCPGRPPVLLLRLVCNALGRPSGLFFLLGFLVSHGLPLCYDVLFLDTRFGGSATRAVSDSGAFRRPVFLPSGCCAFLCAFRYIGVFSQGLDCFAICL